MCRKKIELDYIQDEVREEYLDKNCAELREEIASIQQNKGMERYESEMRLSILKELLHDSRVDFDSF